MIYLIDSNIFIKAHRETHPLDIHPSFWEKLKDIFDRKDICSIDKVKDELFYYEDDLKTWCKDNIEKDFWKNSAQSIIQYAEIQNWVSSKKYFSTAISDFADAQNADPFLISFALFQKQSKIDVTIVTHEVSAPGSKKSIKIPDVCLYFHIPCIDINMLFRTLKISF